MEAASRETNRVVAFEWFHFLLALILHASMFLQHLVSLSYTVNGPLCGREMPNQKRMSRSFLSANLGGSPLPCLMFGLAKCFSSRRAGHDAKLTNQLGQPCWRECCMSFHFQANRAATVACFFSLTPARLAQIHFCARVNEFLWSHVNWNGMMFQFCACEPASRMPLETGRDMLPFPPGHIVCTISQLHFQIRLANKTQKYTTLNEKERTIFQKTVTNADYHLGEEALQVLRGHACEQHGWNWKATLQVGG